MKLLLLIPKFRKALQAGEEISNPKAWKKGQNLINSVAAIITVIVAVIRYKWPDILVSDEQILDIATVIAGMLAVINGFLTTATTKKIGV